MSCYYVEMYNFPEDPEWKNKELYFTNIQKAVKYYKTFEIRYDCATIGEEIKALEGSRQKRTKRIYYERIVVKEGKTKIKDNRSLYKLKSLNKL